MYVSILLAAWISFGQLSFDLSSVATAQGRLMDSLKERNFRAVRKELDRTDGQGNVTVLDQSESIDIHAVTNAGHYYEQIFSNGKIWVDCFTRDRSFRAIREMDVWIISNLHAPEFEKTWSRSFLQGPYRGLFFFDVTALADRIRSPGFIAASLPLDRKRTLIWGHSPKGNISTMATVHFRAIVRFSDSRQLAFNEWSDSLAIDSFAMRVVTTTNARFVTDTFDCSSIEVKVTQYPNCRTEEDVKNDKTAFTVRSCIDHSSDVDIKDEQLKPEHYGIDEGTIQRIVYQSQLKPVTRPNTPRPTLLANDSVDLALAIGIPVVLLGVLLIVIRKT